MNIWRRMRPRPAPIATRMAISRLRATERENSRFARDAHAIRIRQKAAPNTPITQSETVTVFVSTGPPQVNIPDVTGQNVNDARKQLEQLGFKVNVNKIGPFNKVLTENPTGQAPKGTTITLFTGF